MRAKKPSKRDKISGLWVERLQDKLPKHPNRLTLKLTKTEAGLLAAIARGSKETPGAVLRRHIQQAARKLPKKLVKALQQYERAPVAGE